MVDEILKIHILDLKVKSTSLTIEQKDKIKYTRKFSKAWTPNPINPTAD